MSNKRSQRLILLGQETKETVFQAVKAKAWDNGEAWANPNSGSGEIESDFHGDPKRTNRFFEYKHMPIVTPKWDTKDPQDFCTNAVLVKDASPAIWQCLGHGSKRTDPNDVKFEEEKETEPEKPAEVTVTKEEEFEGQVEILSACPSCTYKNETPSAKQCEICQTSLVIEKPQPASEPKTAGSISVATTEAF